MKRVFITGGTNGAGKAAALNFAEAGFDVNAGFSGGIGAAVKAYDDLKAAGTGEHDILEADITDEAQRAHIARTLRAWTHGSPLEHLVLSASGGLEKGKPDSYAHEINVVAQVGIIRSLGEQGLIGDETTVTLVTSHQAYYYGQTLPDMRGDEQPIASWASFCAENEYETVAASKLAGQSAVRAEIDTLFDDTRAAVVSTDIIFDSRVIKSCAARLRDLHNESTEQSMARILRTRRAELEALNLDSTLFSTAEFGKAIFETATDYSWIGYQETLLPEHPIGFLAD